jgi:O-antigen/teichoic acid export membrane protein
VTATLPSAGGPGGQGSHDGGSGADRGDAAARNSAAHDSAAHNNARHDGAAHDRYDGATHNHAEYDSAADNSAASANAAYDGVGAHDAAELGKIARGSTLNLVGAGLSAAATLGVTILVTRQFSRPVAGAFFAATSLFLIIENLANLGSYNGVIYFIARLRTPRQLRHMIRVAVAPVIIVSVTAACVVFAFAHPLARLLLGGRPDTGADPASVAHALRLLALTVPFASLLDTFLGASRGFHDMRPTVLVDRIGRSVAQLAGVGVAALAGATALLAPLWALPYVPASVLAWLWFRRISGRRARAGLVGQRDPPMPPAGSAQPGNRMRAVDPTPRAADSAIGADPSAATSRVIVRGPSSHRSKVAGAGPFWRFTAPRAMATTAQIVIQRLDIVLVGILRGPVDAAVYTAATRFLVVGQLGNMAIGMAAQPQLAQLFAVRDRHSANAVYQATTAWLIILTWPLYLLAVIYGPAVLVIFGHSYRAGSGVVVILGLTMLLTTACGQVDVVLTTAGRSSWSLANWLLAVGINVGVDLALIPKYGIIGAAIGWAVALAVMNFVMLAEVGAIVRVSPFGRGCLAASVLAAASFGAIPFGLRVLGGRGPAVSVLAVVLGCAVYGIGLWRLRRTLQLTAMPGLAALSALTGAPRRSANPARLDVAAGPGPVAYRPDPVSRPDPAPTWPTPDRSGTANRSGPAARQGPANRQGAPRQGPAARQRPGDRQDPAVRQDRADRQDSAARSAPPKSRPGKHRRPRG